MNQRDYWNDIYSSQDVILPKQPSSFSTWVSSIFPIANQNLYDWGAGNGRDSIYFTELCKNVIALDQSESAILGILRLIHEHNISNLSALVVDIGRSISIQIHESNERNYHYSRFFLHAIDDSALDSYFSNLSKICSSGEIVMAEYRAQTEKEISYNWHQHERWLRNPDEVSITASKYGFNLLEEVKGFGLAVYKNEDPFIVRQAWEKIK